MTTQAASAPFRCWLCVLWRRMHPSEAAPEDAVTAEAFVAHLRDHRIAPCYAKRLCVPPAQDVRGGRLPVRLNPDDVEPAVMPVTIALPPHRLTHGQILAELDAARWDVLTLPVAVGGHLIVCDDFRDRPPNTLATALSGGPLIAGPALYGRYGIDFGGPRGTAEWT